MLSKSNRSSKKRHDNLVLVTLCSKNQEREAPTYITKDKENMESIRTTSPRSKKIKTLERQRSILESDATSIRAIGMTLPIATQSSLWWPK
jgi:hypothetical protein